MAWRGPIVPEGEVYATDLLVSVLGGGRSSRLQQTLRERLGLVSSISASFYPQREAGTIMVTARTTAAKRREVEEAVLAEIEEIRTALVEERELARALTSVEAGYAFGHETAEGVAYGYGSAETVWTLEFELTYLDEVRRVTREQVREAARRWLSPTRFTLAALGPPEDSP
jgi:predicted Zn-dependent peptidase